MSDQEKSKAPAFSRDDITLLTFVLSTSNPEMSLKGVNIDKLGKALGLDKTSAITKRWSRLKSKLAKEQMIPERDSEKASSPVGESTSKSKPAETSAPNESSDKGVNTDVKNGRKRGRKRQKVKEDDSEKIQEKASASNNVNEPDKKEKGQADLEGDDGDDSGDNE